METIDEEGLLLSELMEIRNRIRVHKEIDNMRKLDKNLLERRLEEAEQAIVDYMEGNGLKQFESGHNTVTLGYTNSVDIKDVDAVPDEYCRVKTIKEPNKALLTELFKAGSLPENNWMAMKTNPKITVNLK